VGPTVVGAPPGSGDGGGYSGARTPPGGVAEWFRQGPAKPCTPVRFRSPPPWKHPVQGQFPTDSGRHRRAPTPSKRNTESRNGSRRHRMAARLVTRRGVRPSVAARLRAVTAPPGDVAVQGPDRVAIDASIDVRSRPSTSRQRGQRWRVPCCLVTTRSEAQGASVGREGAAGDRSPSGGRRRWRSRSPPAHCYLWPFQVPDTMSPSRMSCRSETTQGSDRPQSVKHLKVDPAPFFAGLPSEYGAPAVNVTLPSANLAEQESCRE
jgi:hypothetical protein